MRCMCSWRTGLGKSQVTDTKLDIRIEFSIKVMLNCNQVYIREELYASDEVERDLRAIRKKEKEQIAQELAALVRHVALVPRQFLGGLAFDRIEIQLVQDR